MNQFFGSQLANCVDLTIPLTRNIPSSLIVYTDGSWTEDEPYAGIGVYIPQQSIRIASRLHGHVQNIDRAETQAAVTALKIARHYLHRYTSITLRTDSLNLIFFVRHWRSMWQLYCWNTIREHIACIKLQCKNYTAGNMVDYMDDFDELFEAMEGIEVHWQKVKSHSDNRGNDTSDTLSKCGRKLPYDNRQLYESLKSRLNLAPNSHFENVNRPNRYTRGIYSQEFKQILEIIQVPLHFSDSDILGVLGDSQIIASKNLDKGTTRDVAIRVPKSTFLKLMQTRQIQMDRWISCPVNPCILQCGKCLVLGSHSSKLCRNKIIRCGNCAERGHEWKRCPTARPGDMCKPIQDTCANCKDRGMDSSHSVFSNSCPLRKAMQESIVAELIAKERRNSS